MALRHQSNDSLETQAAAFLDANAKGTYDGRALRIESVIEKLGYIIFPVPGLVEIADAYIPIKAGYIFVDEDQYLNGSFRWRFSLAEELAHLLIHRPLFDGKSVAEIVAFQQALTEQEYLRIEREAKYLAGCLLMPRAVFQERFAQFLEIQSQQTPNSLAVLKFVIRQLSMDFHVSCYCVALRALHLHLIDQQQLGELIEASGW